MNEINGYNLELNVDKDYKGVLNISGKSVQATRSGKNKLNTFKFDGLSDDGVVATVEKDGKINLVGTATSYSNIHIPFSLSDDMLGKVYTISISGTYSGISNLGFKKGSGESITTDAILYSGSTKRNITITQELIDNVTIFDIYIASGTTINDGVYIQFEEGSNVTDYEPYGVSPSPDYPSEIKSCGDNIQLFDKDNINKVSLIPSGGTNMQYVSSSINSSIYIPITGGKTYTVSRTVLTNRFSLATSSDVPTLNGSLIDFYGAGTNATHCSLTTSSSAKYLCVYLTNDGVNFDEVLETLKIEEGSKETPWTPYGQGGINIKKENKNLYNYKDISNINAGFEIDDEGWVTLTCDNTQGNSVKYFNYFTNISKILKPNTYYSIILEVKTVSGEGRLYINSIDKTNITQFPYPPDLANYFNNLSNNLVKKTVIKTLEDFSNATIMLRSFLMFPIGQSGSITFRISIIEDINIDIENFKYIPHQLQLITVPTQKPFRSIGDVKDTFIKQNGTDYEKHNIDRKIFNGTENWTKATAVNGNTRFTLSINAKANTIPMCNYFKGLLSSEYGCIFIGNYGEICLQYEASTLDEWKSYLAEQYANGTPVYVDYILAEPELIKCTLRQNVILDELENLYLYDGIYYINTIDEIQAELSLKYLKIVEEYDFYISSNGYLIIPEYDIKYLINFSESNIPSMPEAAESTVRVAGKDGDIVLKTTYEPIPFEIVCYTEDNLTPEEKIQEEEKVDAFLDSIKNKTKTLAFEESKKFYKVKYSGALTKINYPAHLQFTIPLKSSASYAMNLIKSSIIGNGDKISNTIKDVGAIFTIEGPAQTPKISLNNYEMSYNNVLLEGTKLEINSNNSTITHIKSDGTKTNAMRYYNHQFPKIKKGQNELKILSGINDELQVSVKWYDLKL